MSIVKYQFKDIFVVTLLLISGSLFGQDFKRDYRSAKEFYEDEKFNFAMDAFRPLMVYDKDNPYVEYATFYYALSAYHQSYLAVAKEALLQLKKLYPEWAQMDEVKYWLAVVHFMQGETFQALRLLYEMRSPRDLSSIERMKNNYLIQIHHEDQKTCFHTAQYRDTTQAEPGEERLRAAVFEISRAVLQRP